MGLKQEGFDGEAIEFLRSLAPKNKPALFFNSLWSVMDFLKKSSLFLYLTRIELVFPPWKGDVLTTRRKVHVFNAFFFNLLLFWLSGNDLWQYPEVFLDGKWVKVDLNYRPRPYQGRALTNWAISPQCQKLLNFLFFSFDGLDFRGSTSEAWHRSQNKFIWSSKKNGKKNNFK